MNAVMLPPGGGVENLLMMICIYIHMIQFVLFIKNKSKQQYQKSHKTCLWLKGLEVADGRKYFYSGFKHTSVATNVHVCYLHQYKMSHHQTSSLPYIMNTQFIHVYTVMSRERTRKEKGMKRQEENSCLDQLKSSGLIYRCSRVEILISQVKLKCQSM